MNTQLIMISGYKQFDYAYQALKHGAVDFLIKPINARDLNNVLSRICQKINHIEVPKEYVEQLQQKVEVAEIKKRKQWMLNAYTHSSQRIMADVRFEGEVVFCVAVKADLSSSFSESDMRIMEKIQLSLRKAYDQVCMDYETVLADDVVLSVLTIYQKGLESFYRFNNKCFRSIKNQLDTYSHLKIAMGISLPRPNDGPLEPCIHEAVNAVICHTVLGNDNVIDARTIDFEEPIKQVPLATSRKIQQYLETLDKSEMKALLKGLTDSAAEKYTQKPRQLRSLIYELVTAVQGNLRLQENQCLSPLWEALPVSLEQCASFEAMCNTLLTAVDDLMRCHEEHRKKQNSMPIRTVKQYIEQHIHEELSLESISGAVGFSKNYLCKLFKNEMDTTIMLYITDIRIERAKALLKDPRLNISEIAVRVGYRDPKYFSRQFMRYVRVSPKEYRKIMPA